MEKERATATEMKTIERAMAELPQESEEKAYSKWYAIAFFVLAGVLMGLIVLASSAADSRMTALRWVPGWMADWADSDPNIRTAIPFIPLAFSLVLGFSWRRF